MPTIDDKVVAMSFENSKFEAGVRTTMTSLDRLKKSLQFNEVGRGLNNLNSINRANFSPLNKSVDQVRAHFSALNVAAAAIIAHIAIMAFDAGARIAKALTIGPIIQGLDIYQTKLQAIQTILANTQAAGTKMKDVTAALQQLNVYANKTIYSFGQMTKNIGTFTAAGVGLKPAVSAIKGIANLAALSGSNADQASTAMYQLSQAISAGRVSLQDWNSVVNAGMGGSVFQRALAQTAVAMGKIKDSSLKLVGPMKNVSINGESFRQSIQSGPGKTSWLSSDVLTKTLSTFTGDMTDAQLAAEGFNKQQIKDIQQTAKTALNAATQVKTFSQLMDVTKETIATGWSQSFELIIGNLGEAKKLFTDISNSMSNMINASAASRNKILTDWKKLGGRTLLIKALGEVFKSLGDVLTPIKDAFRDIFPRKTGRDLFNLTKQFKQFADTLKPSQRTIDDLRRTFRGLFAIVDIGKQIIGGIIGVFHNLFHAVGLGHGSFLDITARIGDFLVAIDLALKRGKGLEHFFTGLSAVLAVPIKLFGAIGHAIAHMFDGFSLGHFSVDMSGATKAAEPFKKILDVIIEALQGLGPAISNAVQNMNFDLILSIIRTGLLAGLVLMLKKFIGGTTLEKTLGIFGKQLGYGFGKNLGGGILGNLSKAFGGLTGSLKSMQRSLQAQTLERIAIAIALLSASILALSLVKPNRLNAALGAIAIGFGELIGVMVLMDKLSTGRGTVKLPIIAASLVLMATAIDIMALAVFALAKLSPREVIQGLGAITILLGTVAAAMKLMPKGLIFTSTSMISLAIALNIMGLAVRQLGSMDLVAIGKGIGAIAGVLVAIAIGMKLMPKGLIFTSTSMLILSVALNALALAIKRMGDMDLKTIGKGLLGISGALVAIAIAMQLMPGNLIFMAVGLLGITAALRGLAEVVKEMAIIPTNKLARGLIGLGGALVILAAGLKLMAGSYSGATVLALAGVGLGLLVPAIIALGKQSWGTLVKGFIALGAALTIVGIAADLLAPSIPYMLGFGAALILIGAGLALAGAGIALVGVGFGAIAISGSAAIAVLINGFAQLIDALVHTAKSLVLGVLEIVKTFAEVAPQFVKALVKIINAMSEGVIKSAPKLAEALVVLLTKALEALDKHSDEIIKAGFDILEKLLQGIGDNIGEVVTMAVTIVVNLVDSLAKNANRLVSAGFNLLTSIITGITNNIDKFISVGADIIIKFVKGIANNYEKIINAGANILIHLLNSLGNDLKRFAVAGGQAITHFITGIGDATHDVVVAAINMAIRFVHTLVNQMVRMENVVARGIVRLLNATADVIDKYEPQIIKATARIGFAIVTGMVKGVGLNSHLFYDKIKDLAQRAWDHLKHFWKIFSPSQLTHGLGKNIVLGLAHGLDATAPEAISAIDNMNSSIFNALDKISTDNFDTSPKITPVLDLSSIKNKAGELDGIINKTPLGSISLDHAATISARQHATGVEKDLVGAVGGGSTIKFEQHNFSPKSLPPSEIYRNTRNQLSQLKLLVDTRGGS